MNYPVESLKEEKLGIFKPLNCYCNEPLDYGVNVRIKITN